MPLKTKISKILPYWLSVLLMFITLQNLSSFTAYPSVGLAQRPAAQPEVLGESTDLRGQPQTPIAPPQINNQLDLSQVTAKSLLVYDLDTGNIIAQKDPDIKLPIASLTKLLTALIVYQKTDLNAEFTVTGQDILDVSPSLGLRQGEQFKILDVWRAMLVGSCNDAAVALADYVATKTQTSFIDLMEQQATALSMDNSLFSNPMGFDIGQNYSTAEDLKKLVDATQSLPAFSGLDKLTGYSFTTPGGKTYRVLATNKLIAKYPDLEAVKTGYTETAQGSMITKLNLNGRQIVIIVLGSESREQDTLKLRSELLKNSNI